MGKYLELLQSAGLNKGRVAGISSAEIDELATAQGQTKLPAAYRDFMADCGRGAGLFQCDAVFFFPCAKWLKQQLKEMIADENIDFVVPLNAFVFGAYQGFQFHYFLCDSDEDPAVYQIDDGKEGALLVSESFSNYILNGVEQYRVAHRTKYGANPPRVGR